MTLNFCGTAAAVMTLAGYGMYLADKKRFHPDVKAWGTITAVGFLAFFGALFSGSKESLLMLLADALLPLTVLVYSAKKLGTRGLVWRKENALMSAVFIGGLGTWTATGNPAAGLAASAILDWRAGMLLMKKTWRRPGSEPLWSWVVTTSACLLNLAAATGDGPEEFCYILSFTTIQLVVVSLLFRFGCGTCRWPIGFLPIRLACPCPAILTLSKLPPPEYDNLPGWVWS